MSDLIDFRNKVQLDLAGKIDGFQDEDLSGDPQLWRDELVSMLQQNQKSIVEYRAKSFSDGRRAVRNAFETFRGEATNQITQISARIRDVKVLLREQNVEEHGGSTSSLLKDILAELRSFRSYLESCK